MKRLLFLFLVTVSAVTANAQAVYQRAAIQDYSTQSWIAAPPANYGRVYFNGSALVCVKSDGTSCLSGGAGTVTVTGSPSAGQIAKFSSSTSITNALAADIVATFSGCSGVQYLGADGACHSAGVGDIKSAPAGAQTIIQPYVAGPTTLNVNDFNNVVYVTPDFNWSQTPAGTLAAATPATVTLAPCPKGSLTTLTNKNVTMWISGVGTPEQVTLTASTCVSDAATGTVTFTPANSHSAGWGIGSNSAGIEEAVNYAYTLFTGSASTVVSSGGTVIVPPQLNPTINGTAYIQASNITVDFSHNVLQCQTTIVPCVFVGNPLDRNSYFKTTVENLRLRAMAAELIGIEVNAQGTTIDDISDLAVGSTGTFYPAFIVGDDDESFTVRKVEFSGSLSANVVCTSLTHCTSVILMTGSPNFGILHASDVNAHSANCIDNQGGNTLVIDGYFICQSTPMFMVRSNQIFADNQNLDLNASYMETTFGTSPIPGAGAGIILRGGVSHISAGNYGGHLPVFSGTTGATRFNYYVVAKDGSGNAGPALLAGYASTNGATGAPVVVFADIGGTTYDVLRVQGTGAGIAPTTNSCGGGSINACGSRFTAQAEAAICDTTPSSATYKQCTVTDDISASTSAYTVPTVAFGPDMFFWPGAVVNSTNTTGGSLTPTNNAKAIIDNLIGGDVTQGTYVSAFGASSQAFIANRCGAASNGWTMNGINCQSYGSNINGATWVRPGANGITGLSGVYNFSPAPGHTFSGDIFTYRCADVQLCFSTPFYRPAWQAGDTATGYETAGSGGIYTRDANSIRGYIGKVPDNAPQEILTSAAKTFTVPVVAAGLTINTITGSTKWLTVNTSGVVSGVAAPVTTFSGDGTIFNNSASTGAVTATLANTPTGTGGVVLQTSPTLITPLLGTPTSGVLTNATGYLWNSIASPTGNQTLTMTGDSTTWNWGSTNTNKFAFDTSGNVTFGLVNSTTAVTNSPSITIGASYQNAATPTFAADTWQIQDVISAGTNGASTLTFSKPTGSPGFAVSMGGLPLTVGSLTSQGNVTVTGITGSTKFATVTNCAAVGTAASPSVVSCSSAAAGAFSCATNASAATCTINTTAVTANSEIIVQEVADEGTRLSVTCNTAPTVSPAILVASKTAATGFTINMPTITTNPACFDYWIVN